MGVLCADNLGPFAGAASIIATPISYRRRPRHCENTVVLDSEQELQMLAPIVGIDVHSNRAERRALQVKILFCIPFQPFFRGLVVEKPVVLAAVRIRAKTAENLTDGRRTGGAAVGCGLSDRKFDCLPPTIGL